MGMGKGEGPINSINHHKGFGFYSGKSGKPWEDSKQSSDMALLIFSQIHLAAVLRIDCRVERAAAGRPVSRLLHFLNEITH